MAYRRRGRRLRRKPNLNWDVWTPAAQADLPSCTLTNAVSLAGATTSLRRYSGSDLLLRRTIGRWLCRVLWTPGTSATPGVNTVLHVCVGLRLGDNPTELNGEALNIALSSGTGPVSDADNSRYYVRCCLDLPIGQHMSLLGNTNENLVVTPTPSKGYVAYGPPSGTTKDWDVWCEFDTKSIRKFQGLESDWVNVDLECELLGTIPAGTGTLDILMNSFEARCVLQAKG